jgi:putative SOS response-associated peptidase YedK
MCGRYSIGKGPTQLAAELEASLAIEPGTPEAEKARFNIAPSQRAPMLIAHPDRRLGMARFGWRLDGKKGLLLNARSETSQKNGLFRAALERRRALIPADGFYEWKVREGTGKKPEKDPFFLHQEGALITFAGLYYVEKGLDEEATGTSTNPSPDRKSASFVIMTTAASPQIAVVHDRMPIIVPPEWRSDWLDVRLPVDELLTELMHLPPPIQMRLVSPRVGSPTNDDPTLHDPLAHPDPEMRPDR